MPRDLVLGNGTLLVNLDRNLNIRDLYFPYVGMYNHALGYKSRIGVWVSGQFSWLDDTWSTRLGYKSGTLTTDVHVSNGRLGIGLRFNDTVHPQMNLFLRRVSVENLRRDEREIRLFFGQDFRLNETDIGDTVFFHPFTQAIVHYKRDTYILISGRAGESGLYEYTTGVKAFRGAEGTWRDAEDGVLSMNPIEQGSVDSTISFRLTVPGDSSSEISYWIAVGHTLDEVVSLNSVVAERGVQTLSDESEAHWKGWLEEGATVNTDLPAQVRELYERSLLILMTQVDKCGGVIAANDSDIMETARAHYSYVWPRDGSFAVYALDMAGHREPAVRFFNFMAHQLRHDRPFFLQKYSPDGTLGATWHPWVADGEPEIPHQQDSTALVLWAIGKHHQRWGSSNFPSYLYEDVVMPAADHMIETLHPVTNLPLPSYDLWEQRRAIHLWTCCAVCAALSAATRLARVFDKDRADYYRRGRDSVRKAIIEHFADPNGDRFVRSLMEHKPREHLGHSSSAQTTQSKKGSKIPALAPDPVIDASMAGVFLFEVLPPDAPRVVGTMQAIYDRLWVRTPIGGLARYEDDYYFQVTADVRNVPGNPWFVTTMWMAEWYVAVARSIRDLEPASDLIQWAVRRASEAGLLAEQVHPFTGEPIAVMPLTWSHAAFVSAVQRYAAKLQELMSRRAAKA